MMIPASTAIERSNRPKVQVENLAETLVAIAARGTKPPATPLIDDGFMYISDAGGRLQDRRPLRHPWQYRLEDGPGQEKIDRNRGSRCGTISSYRSPADDGRIDCDRQGTGKIVWDKNLRDQPDMTLNAVPLALEDST